MKITKFQHQPIKDTPHKLDVREMYPKESAQAIRITLKPGESIKPPKTPVDVVNYISNETDKLAGILIVKAPLPTATARVL